MPQPHDILFRDARRSDAAGHLRAAVPRRRPDGRGPDGAGRRLAAGRLEASRGPEAGRAGARPPRRPPDALQRAARRPGPADRLDKPDGRLLAKPVRRPRRPTQTDGPMSNTRIRNALRRRRTGDPTSAGKDLARAHPTTPDRGVADEERFQACRGPPFQSSAQTGARVDCQVLAVEPNKTLSYTWGDSHGSRASSPGPSPRRAREPTCAWSSRASGRISSRLLPGRQGRVAEVLCEPGAGLGADGLKTKAEKRA